MIRIRSFPAGLGRRQALGALAILAGLLGAPQAAPAASRPVLVKALPGPAGGVKLALPFRDPSDPGLQVPRLEDQEQLALARPGDEVRCVVDEAGQKVEGIQGITRSAGGYRRLGALLAGFALVLIPASLATGWRPLRFLVGVDNRYSKSQVQIAVWFTTVATVYAAAVLVRFSWGQGLVGGVGLPGNLLALSGLSALSFGGAKAITSRKVANALQDQEPPVKPPAARCDLAADLVENDLGQADLGDFQMILVTGAAAVIFLVSAYYFLGAMPVAREVMLPDVDTTLLSAFGLGQGAYLLKKAVLRAGEG